MVILVLWCILQSSLQQNFGKNWFNQFPSDHWSARFVHRWVTIYLMCGRNRSVYKRPILLHCETRLVTFTAQCKCKGILHKGLFGLHSNLRIGIVELCPKSKRGVSACGTKIGSTLVSDKRLWRFPPKTKNLVRHAE